MWFVNYISVMLFKKVMALNRNLSQGLREGGIAELHLTEWGKIKETERHFMYLFISLHFFLLKVIYAHNEKI